MTSQEPWRWQKLHDFQTKCVLCHAIAMCPFLPVVYIKVRPQYACNRAQWQSQLLQDLQDHLGTLATFWRRSEERCRYFMDCDWTATAVASMRHKCWPCNLPVLQVFFFCYSHTEQCATWLCGNGGVYAQVFLHSKLFLIHCFLSFAKLSPFYIFWVSAGPVHLLPIRMPQ